LLEVEEALLLSEEYSDEWAGPDIT